MFAIKAGKVSGRLTVCMLLYVQASLVSAGMHGAKGSGVDSSREACRAYIMVAVRRPVNGIVTGKPVSTNGAFRESIVGGFKGLYQIHIR
jgi:hypothetical protein